MERHGLCEVRKTIVLNSKTIEAYIDFTNNVPHAPLGYLMSRSCSYTLSLSRLLSNLSQYQCKGRDHFTD